MSDTFDDGLGSVESAEGRRSSMPPLLHRIEFVRNGLTVEQRVYRWQGGRMKLVWCLKPLEDMKAQGRDNWIVSHDFPEGDVDAYRTSKRRVVEAFYRHYFPEQDLAEAVGKDRSLDVRPDLYVEYAEGRSQVTDVVVS